ncbi:uncharacterized protein LOC135081980 [Ostrinia nubilalis]|uniref:uncharacterized protein LOC135081980 n=1 Tax=Ostrinia nubilalis TaxID=29057 RepID=UPI00308250A7
MELFNKSNKVLIRGSMRCVRDIKNAQVKAEAYLWSRGKWMPHITFPGLSCDNALIRTIITAATNVRVSADDCTLMKGYYNTSGMEVNWIEHMWAQERVYGNVLWKVVLYTPKNTLACYMVEAEVKPLKH